MTYNIKVKIRGDEQELKMMKTDYKSFLVFDQAYYMMQTLYELDYLTELEYTAILKRLGARIEDHLNELNKDFKHKIEIVI